MTGKETILINDSEKKSKESFKLSLKEKVLSVLKSFREDIASSLKNNYWKENPEGMKYGEESLEEIRRRYF